MIENVTSKFSAIQQDGTLIEIENMPICELVAGSTYVMNAPMMGDYLQAEARVSKDADALTVIFIGLDDEDAAVEQKGTTSITFKLELLQLLQARAASLVQVRGESQFFMEFLMNTPDLGVMLLDTLIETVAFEIIQADGWGTFRSYDNKYGTNFRTMVTGSRAGQFQVDEVYDDLCRFCAKHIAEDGVTLTWAIREYE